VWAPALLGLAIVVVLTLRCPWWTKQRSRRHLIAVRRGWRGRHRFGMPPVDPQRIWVGPTVLGGRAVGQLPDSSGQGGWIGRLDVWGRLHVDRWV
jgi:hypothetical protein